MKKTIVIMSDYVEIGRESGRLKIVLRDRKSTIPISNVDGLLIYGKTTITSDAISLCMDNSIPIVLISKKGMVKAVITGPNNSSGLKCRLKQAELYFKKRLEVAKYIVKRKILEIEYVFDLDLLELKRSVDKAQDYHVLLGLEGVASREMFSCLANALKDTAFSFTERSYNPPKDEINALLSFVYTLGYVSALGLICLKGFDPYISYLHLKRGEHPAFASDLMEIIRPHLTKFVIKLVTEGGLNLNQFEKREEAIFLKKEAVNYIVVSLDAEKEYLIALMKEFLMELQEFK